MRQSAQVIRCVSPGRVEVKVRRAAACSSAHKCDSCEGCSLLAGAPEVVVVAQDDLGAQAGDTVTVESPAASVLGAAVSLYVVPILLFFAGYLLGLALGWNEGTSIALGGGGFGMGELGGLALDRYRKHHRPVEYRVVAIEG